MTTLADYHALGRATDPRAVHVTRSTYPNGPSYCDIVWGRVGAWCYSHGTRCEERKHGAVCPREGDRLEGSR